MGCPPKVGELLDNFIPDLTLFTVRLWKVRVFYDKTGFSGWMLGM
jgi:hypothetical protein